MFIRRFCGHLRRHLVAYVALFFALSATAVATPRFLTASDTIPAGDLRGSTYGDPLIAGGAVTNGKLANPSLTISAGTGLTGGGSVALGGSTTLNVDPTAVQSRVRGTCSSGSAISSINQNGSVGCQSTGGSSTAGPHGLDVIEVSAEASSGTATATCPADHPYATGGGGSETVGGLPQAVTASPTVANGQPNGWEASTPDFGVNLTAYAICTK